MRRVLEQIRAGRARPIRRCCCSARPAPARSSLPPQIHELSARRSRAMVRVNCARDPVDAHRERAVRPREGRLHRRASRGRSAASSSPTTRRSSSTRSATCRRTSRSSCCACSRSGRSNGSAARQAIRVDTRDHRRDAPQSRAADRRRRVPRGPVLPAERLPDSGAAAARARRRHSAAGVALRRRVLEAVRQADRRRFRATTWRRCSATRWPGNIRELRNVVERAMIVATGSAADDSCPVRGTPAARQRSAKLVDVQKEHIRGVLEATRWRIRGSGRRRRSTRPAADDARDADGQARDSRPKPS